MINSCEDNSNSRNEKHRRKINQSEIQLFQKENIVDEPRNINLI